MSIIKNIFSDIYDFGKQELYDQINDTHKKINKIINLPVDAYSYIQKQIHDLNKGVWIGYRPLKDPGLGIKDLMLTPLVAHHCVLIDNVCYSLTTDSGSQDGIIEINKTQDKDYRDWNYQGVRQRSFEDIDLYVQFINLSKIQYGIFEENCQKYSLLISNFAIRDKYSNPTDKLGSSFPALFEEKSGFTYLINKNRYDQILSYDEYEKLEIDQKLDFLKKYPKENAFEIYRLENEKFINMKKNYKFKNISTIGQLNKDITTIGQMSRKIDLNNNIQYQKQYGDRNVLNYSMDFLQKNQRQQYSGINYGPNMYSQPEFNLRSNPNQNTGFLNQGPLIPTVRKSFFSDYKSYNPNQNLNIQSFQNLNYDLPKQVQLSKLPFYAYNDQKINDQPFKKVKTNDTQINILDYNNADNDYTNQNEYQNNESEMED